MSLIASAMIFEIEGCGEMKITDIRVLSTRLPASAAAMVQVDTDEGIVGIGEGGRSVLFKEEVAYPSKSISTCWHQIKIYLKHLKCLRPILLQIKK